MDVDARLAIGGVHIARLWVPPSGQPAARGSQGRPAGGDPVVVLGLAAGTEPGRFEHQACSLSAASASAGERQACCPHRHGRR